MELSLSTHLFVYQKLDDRALDAIADSPLKSLEVWLASPHLPWRNATAMDGLKQRLQDRGLNSSSVHLPLYPSVPELLEKNRRWSLIDPDPVKRQEALKGTHDGILCAALLGASQAVLHLGWPSDSWDDSSYAFAQQALTELLPVANANGVQIAIENITSPGTSVEAILKMLDQVDPSGNAGICLDVGHSNLGGDVCDQLRLAAPRLNHLHLHDNRGDSDQHLSPGTGNLNWPDIHSTLSEIGFAGFGAIEVRDYSKGKTLQEVLLHQALEAASEVLPDLPRYSLTI